jgi:hypothetical protein
MEAAGASKMLVPIPLHNVKSQVSIVIILTTLEPEISFRLVKKEIHEDLLQQYDTYLTA